MLNFIIKCVVVTACIIVLFHFLPVQRYHFYDRTHRVNLVTGSYDYYSTEALDRGWHSQ